MEVVVGAGAQDQHYYCLYVSVVAYRHLGKKKKKKEKKEKKRNIIDPTNQLMRIYVRVNATPRTRKDTS